jgi:hypothetical protein
MFDHLVTDKAAVLFASFLAGSLAANVSFAQLIPEQVAEPVAVSKLSATAISAATSASWHERQGLYYKRNWGLDVVGIKPVSSGYMLAFRYRILDPAKAKMLNDLKSKAYAIDEVTGIRLAVPAMENVGELRTGSTAEAGRTYFMIFGNPGRLVKTGSRVTVVAGNLHIDGLVVD